MRPRALIGLVGGVLVVAATVAGVLFGVSVEGSTPQTTGSGFPKSRALPVGPDDQPLVDGERVTLQAAIDEADFPLFRPAHPLAADGSLQTVWLARHSFDDTLFIQIALLYESGIKVRLDAWDGPPDVTRKFQAIVEENPNGFVGTILGQPALIFPPATDMLQSNRASVGFVMDGVYIVLYGAADTDLESLIDVAETIT